MKAARLHADHEPLRLEEVPAIAALADAGLLRAVIPAEIIVVDPSEPARAPARELGRDHPIRVDGAHLDAVSELTDGLGAEAIVNFVGERRSVEDGIAMIQDGGFS